MMKAGIQYVCIPGTRVSYFYVMYFKENQKTLCSMVLHSDRLVIKTRKFILIYYVIP